MRVLVGITGGVAAYKAAEIIREFAELGHEVRVIPTKNALRFIGISTLEALSHNPVHFELYEEVENVRHIELAQWAQLLVVAPATASFLARSAAGIADDLLGNVVLATSAPIAIYPAMHTEMWENQATQSNVALLRSRGILVIEPAVGRLTGNDTGVGRLPEPKYIVGSALSSVVEQDLSGKKVLIVAGGTREAIDPVRFIGNRSSGKQGIALVEEAISRGAEVKLIAANFEYYAPGIEISKVVSTADLLDEIESLNGKIDFIVMPAAVSDFRVSEVSESKLKKKDVGTELLLHLVQNPDVISALGSRIRLTNPDAKVVGFAAETLTDGELISVAREKLAKKQLDLIVANEVSANLGFDTEDNSVVLIESSSEVAVAGTKREIAKAIFDQLVQ